MVFVGAGVSVAAPTSTSLVEFLRGTHDFSSTGRAWFDKVCLSTLKCCRQPVAWYQVSAIQPHGFCLV